MLSAVGFILIIVMVALMISGKISVPPILVLLPIIAALVCGFGLGDISKFISAGLSSVLNTIVLFTFAIIYFNVLGDAGMFDVIVGKVMGILGNRVSLVLLMTCLIATISHLDGSGATTMLITIPAMLPLYKKMKVSNYLLLLYVSITSGVINMLPWTSALSRAAAASGIEARDLWVSLLPAQIVGLVIVYGSCFVVGKVLEKKGAGMSDAEFEEARKAMIANAAGAKVSKGVLAFDMILTLVLVVALLMGWINTNMGFMIALAIALPVNFPKAKDQIGQIKKHGGNALHMVMIIASIGVLIGVLGQSGMLAAMADTIVGLVPESLGSHITFVMGLLSVPLSMVLGSDSMYTIMVPIFGQVATAFGGTMSAAANAAIIGSCVAANVCLVGASPYLALGLAECEMGENLKKNFLPVWILGIVMVVVAGVTGAIPF